MTDPVVPLSAEPPCQGCGGPHPFDTSVPSPAWNRVIRERGLPDYLCTTCIVAAFVAAGESFEAELYGESFDGLVPVIRVEVSDRPYGSTYGDLAHQLDVELAARSQPAPDLRAAVDEVVALIESGENRAMAADGPVSHFRDELDDREWRRLWVALSKVRSALHPEGADHE